MTKRLYYIFKLDKTGKRRAYKVDTKTGKKTRVPLKIGEKRYKDAKRKEEKAKKIAELEKIGSNWDEYQTQKKKVAKRIHAEYKEEGKKARKGTIDRRAAAEATEKHVGLRSRYRFDWKFWEMPGCNTPNFTADAQATNGDRFDDMVEFCKEVYGNIKFSDLCPKKELGFDNIEGGCCVVLYRKSDKVVIRQFDIPNGVGCVRGV